jgi:hypothetical protein
MTHKLKVETILTNKALDMHIPYNLNCERVHAALVYYNGFMHIILVSSLRN